MKREDMVATSLMNPLGATSLVWWLKMSHPVRDALILTTSVCKLCVKREGIKINSSKHQIVTEQGTVPVKQKKAKIRSGVTQSKARW